jgi:hypothetical protein
MKSIPRDVEHNDMRCDDDKDKEHYMRTAQGNCNRSTASRNCRNTAGIELESLP